MNLTPKVMAYWVAIFATIWIVEALDLMNKFKIDDKSMAIGFVIGALLLKFAPDSKEGIGSSDKTDADDSSSKAAPPKKEPEQ